MRHNYCRAYQLGQLREFEHWPMAADAADAALRDDTIVYLWNDLTVVRCPVSSPPEVLLDSVTPAWREFCSQRLSFQALPVASGEDS